MIDPLVKWGETMGLSHWFLSLLVLVVVLAGLLVVRALVWRKLLRFARRTHFTWDDELLQAINGPMRLLLVVIAVQLAAPVAPDKLSASPTFQYGLQISLILVLIWFAERVVSVAFQANLIPVALGGNSRVLLLTFMRVVVITIGGLVILDTLGVSVTPILASLGVGSVAVALALQDTLSNFFSGIYLLADQPIRIGDFIRMEDGTEGHVVKVGWRSTKVKLLANNIVVVPNSKIASSRITNYDLPSQDTAVLVDVGVSYGSDLAVVERVTTEVGAEVQARVPGAVRGFAPFIRLHTFAESSINFTVILRAEKITDQFLLKHEFIKALHARYRSENIVIPFPQRTVQLVSQKEQA